MKSFKNVKTIFFDYDGTLHNSMKVYEPAFKKAYAYLVKKELVEPREWKYDEIKYWLGFTSIEMWNRFMPDLPKEIKDQAREILGEEIKTLVKNKKAVLYEGVEETLRYLKDKKYKLVFASNCSSDYKELHKKLFSLDKYFDEFACAEEHDFIPKYKFLQKVMKKYSNDMVMIGDRMHDIKAGEMNNIYTIGCSYGFASDGELDNADLVIKDIRELKEYL